MNHLIKDASPLGIGFRFLRLPEVCKVTGLAKSTVWLHSRQGTFPRPVAVSSKVSAWRSDELASWMNNRARVEFTPLDEGGLYEHQA